MSHGRVRRGRRRSRGYCGLPDPVTGGAATALTAFRRRQVLARHGGVLAGPGNRAAEPSGRAAGRVAPSQGGTALSGHPPTPKAQQP